jgi:plasmid stability protein
MGQITIRNLDDAVLQALRRRAAAAGHSTEEEARRSLARAAGVERDSAKARLAAARQSIGRRLDRPTEELVRRAREERTSTLSARTGSKGG